MLREILLLRHGKSDWRHQVSDYDRPLKKRGRKGAKLIGGWLERSGLAPDYVLASPAERALVTAEKCVRALGQKASWVHTDKRLYLADAETVLAILQRLPGECQRVLLVGHNPGLEDLVLKLSGTPPALPDDGKLMPTATLAHFEFNGEWSQLDWGQAHFLEIVRARSLAAEAV